MPDYIDIGGKIRQTRHTNEFWDHYGIAVHPGLHQAGDLIFFSRDGAFPTHIGIVKDKESFIHSPGKDRTRVVVEDIELTTIEHRSPKAVFVANPIGYKSPTLPLSEENYRYTQVPL